VIEDILAIINVPRLKDFEALKCLNDGSLRTGCNWQNVFSSNVGCEGEHVTTAFVPEQVDNHAFPQRLRERRW